MYYVWYKYTVFQIMIFPLKVETCCHIIDSNDCWDTRLALYRRLGFVPVFLAPINYICAKLLTCTAKG